MDDHRPSLASTSQVAGAVADAAPPVEEDNVDDGAESCTDSEDSGVSDHQCGGHGGGHMHKFVFGKPPLPDDDQLPSTVRVLDYPLDSLLSVSSGVHLCTGAGDAGNETAAAATALDAGGQADSSSIFRGAKLYLVGTAHFSEQSQNDVRKIIESTQPDVVMVELCAQRVAMLTMDEATLLEQAKQLDTAKVLQMVKEVGVVQGMMHALLLSLSAHITRQLGMAPGGEFRAAAQSAESVAGCTVLLGDRPISVTLQRALGALGLWQKCRLAYYVLMSRKETISQEDVERCKEVDMLEQLLSEMAGEFPDLSRILVAERDQFMAHYLRTVLQNATVAKINQFQAQRPGGRWQPVRAVAVVGIGHSSGISKEWAKPVDVHSLMSVPPPSLVGRALPYAVRGAVVGVAAYAVYRLASGVYYKFWAQ